jgi:hypothetical protein
VRVQHDATIPRTHDMTEAETLADRSDCRPRPPPFLEPVEDGAALPVDRTGVFAATGHEGERGPGR